MQDAAGFADCANRREPVPAHTTIKKKNRRINPPDEKSGNDRANDFGEP
jgi:hypothetical protein